MDISLVPMNGDNVRNWELKRLTCSINYDAREVSIDYGRTRERVTTL